MDRSLRDLRTTMSPHGLKERMGGTHPSAKSHGQGGQSVPANDELAHRFGGSVRACALMGAPLRGFRQGMRPHGLRDQLRGVQRSTSKAADVAVFASVIDGEGRTRALDDTHRAQEDGQRERERIRPSSASVHPSAIRSHRPRPNRKRRVPAATCDAPPRARRFRLPPRRVRAVVKPERQANSRDAAAGPILVRAAERQSPREEDSREPPIRSPGL